MPRFTPDGEQNAIHIQRLKDKLGNRSNASSEVEFRGAWARLVGEEGRGVPTIIEMVNHTRLDCALGAAGEMRYGTANAIHHASQRSAFGKLLIDQPLMRNVLADLAVESEAATISALRLARAYDESIAGDEQATQFKRIANAVLKYWTTKRAPMHAAEALECFGGNGYVEESGMPRLFPRGAAELDLGGVRQRPVPGRPPRDGRDPESRSRPTSPRSTRPPVPTRASTPPPPSCATSSPTSTRSRPRARRVVEWMALVVQGSLLVRFGDPAVADAFCASRLGGDSGRAFGTLPPGVDFGRIIERHAPTV